MSIVKWVYGGWALFLADNVVLSENRTRLIEVLGSKERYHNLFNTCSTLALGSIAYSFYRLGPGTFAPRSLLDRCLSVLFLVGGSFLLSQIPAFNPRVAAKIAEAKKESDVKKDDVFGVYRCTRHPMLYGAALMSWGVSAFVLHTGTFALCVGMLPVVVLGTMHQDSRYRRGLGGELTPEREKNSPNIPFSHGYFAVPVKELDLESFGAVSCAAVAAALLYRRTALRRLLKRRPITTVQTKT